MPAVLRTPTPNNFGPGGGFGKPQAFRGCAQAQRIRARAPKHPEGLLLSASIFLAFFGHIPGRFLVVVVLA